MRQFLTRLVFMTGIFLIFGCSGGLEEKTVNEKNISLRLDNVQGEKTDKISAESPGRLVAILKNAGGTPIAGETIHFSATLGYVQPTAGVAVTDDRGRAEISLLAGAVPGNGEATATLGEYSDTMNFVTDGDLDISVELQLQNKENRTETDKIGTDAPGRLTATLTYGPEKTPMTGQIITFSTTLGSIHPKDGTALTDHEGRATVDLLPGAEPGPGTASAIFDEYSVNRNFTVQDIALSLWLIKKKTWDTDETTTWKTTNTVSAVSPEYLTATLKYADGEPIADQVIHFSTTLGRVLPALGTSSEDTDFQDTQLTTETTALTDRNGRAKVLLFAGPDPGASEAVATYQDYSERLGFTTVGDQNIYLSVQLITQKSWETDQPGTWKTTDTISADTPGRLIGTLRYGAGTPIVNEVITFSTTLGHIRPESGTALTDQNGMASVLVMAGLEAGAGEAVAAFGEYSETAGFTTEGNGDISISLEWEDGRTDGIRAITGRSPGRLIAVLRDAMGNPMANEMIIFSTTLGNLQSETALTDDNGRAEAELTAGDSDPGAGEVTAASGEYSLASFNFVIASNDIILSLRLTDTEGNETNKIDDTSPGLMTATLEDENGAAIPYEMIAFSTTLGILESSTALTDEKGQAVVRVFAGPAPGAGEAAAVFGQYPPAALKFSIEGNDISLSLRLTDSAGEPVNIIAADAPARLNATLTDMRGEPMLNQLVRFETTGGLGNIQPKSGTALTDSNGQAYVALFAGSKTGTGEAVAKFGEHTSAPWSFTVASSEGTFISLRLTDDQGTLMSNMPAGSTGLMTATLTYAGGTPIPDKMIEFESEQGEFFPKIANTDREGKATVLFVPSAKAGVGDAIATFTDENTEAHSASVSFDIEVQDPEEVVISLRMTDEQGNDMMNIPAGSGAFLTATLTYSGGAPIPNKTVEFDSEEDGKLYPKTAVTNADGKAAVLFVAGEKPGIGYAAAAFEDENSETHSASVSFNIEVSEILIALQLTDDQGILLGDIPAGSTGLMTATLTYADGTPIPNKMIEFESQGGDISPKTANTDKEGKATVSFTAGPEAGGSDATVIFRDENQKAYSASVSFDIKLREIIISLRMTDDQGNETTDVPEGSGTRLTATLTYADGTPVPDKTVSFAVSSGEVYPGTAATDSRGKASVLLSGSEPGIAHASAIFRLTQDKEYSDTLTFNVVEKGINITVQLLNSEGGETNKISADSPGTLIAMLKDTDGIPISDMDIEFTTTLGEIHPSGSDPKTGTVKTDGQGKASVLLLAGTGKGPGDVTVIFRDEKLGERSASVSFMADVEEPVPALSIELTDQRGNRTTYISAGFPGRLKATLKYESGKAIPDETIVFTTTLGNMQPEAGKAVTDSNGEAYVDLFAGSEPGTGVAGATFSEYSASVEFDTAGDQSNLSLRLTDAETGYVSDTVSAASPGRLEAVLIDNRGEPVSGEMVIFTATLGVLYPADGRALTNDRGLAATVLLPGAAQGVGQAEAVSGEYSASVGFNTLGDQKNLTLGMVRNNDGYETDIISAESPGRLEATLSDDSGKPMTDELVTFSVTMGSMQPEDGKVLTDRDGLASVILSAGSVPGPGEAVVEFGEYSDSLNFTTVGDQLRHVNISLLLRESITGEPAYIISAQFPGRLEAVLTDADRNPLPNQVIAFSITPELGVLQPDTGTALTNELGMASIGLLAGLKSGAAQVSAAYGEYVSEPVSFRTEGDQTTVPEIILAIRLVKNENGYETDIVSADSPGRVEAILTNSDGMPIPDQIITFTATSGEILPSGGKALTDSEGRAFVVLLAGSDAGPGVATVEFGEYSSSLGFTTAGDQTADINLTIRLSDDETGAATDKISDRKTGRLEAVLTDVNGMPIPGQMINFSATLGRIEPSVGAALTDEDGTASVRLLAVPYPGPGIATARYDEYSVSLSFEIE